MSSYSEGQAHQLMKRLEAEGFTPEEITNLGQHSQLSMVREWVNDRATIIMNSDQPDTTPVPTTYPVKIDYSDTFEQRLAAGRYDWKNSDITEKHFPVKGEGKVKLDLELAHYAKSMSTEAVQAAIDAQGYRPATIEELLAFGAKYPELQREFPIIALGSVWRGLGGDRSVVYLSRSDRERSLDLDRLEGGAWLGVIPVVSSSSASSSGNLVPSDLGHVLLDTWVS